MVSRTRTVLAVAAVVGLAATGTVSAAARPAAARPTATLSGSGSMLAGPYTVAKLSFSAKRFGSVPTLRVSGTFSGTVQNAPVVLAGPVTCLDVEGNKAGFVYPIAQSSPALVAQTKTAILISVEKGVSGAPSKIGFEGPLPAALLTACKPSLTPGTFEGTLLINGR